MSPKVKGKASDDKGPKLSGTINVSLDDLSTLEASGHRELDSGRVEELVTLFKAGRYGRGLLRGPGVIAGLTDKSGHCLLEDGKHTVAALPLCCTPWSCPRE